MNYPLQIREEELKNLVAEHYFKPYDSSKIIGNIDFCIAHKKKIQGETQSLLWAEAKKGSVNIHTSITQLILTIGKARAFTKHLPPVFLGAFDCEKIAFIEYKEIVDIFHQSDFNWNVRPSDHDTKEFKLVLQRVSKLITEHSLLYSFATDVRDLKKFIATNFQTTQDNIEKIQIDKNNFMFIYYKWFQSVKPSIELNWNIANTRGLIDGDFYLADLLSDNNKTLKEKLFVLLQTNHYTTDREVKDDGSFSSSEISFNDEQKAHKQFWNKYQRPPRKEYWDTILERRDLLVPQDIRERKGSFYTPTIWVELSQKYLATSLGEDWQEEYYIWNCAAGTGNLLVGLVDKYRIWASTVDKQDVDIMKDRIQNGANLIAKHVFQFDFLNDDFSQLPESLKKIIDDEAKRKKLIIYINPPYAEATSSTTMGGIKRHKAGVTTIHKLHNKYKSKIKQAANEIFALFMTRIYDEIPEATIGQFSKLKFVQGSNFEAFRNFFRAKYLGGFVVRANTFDNVKGNFPIGFTIWNLCVKEKLEEICCDVLSNAGNKEGEKIFSGNLPDRINKWIKSFDIKHEGIGFMGNPAPDFQHNNLVFLSKKKDGGHFNYFSFISSNLIEGAIYFAVRHCIEADWLNDRDQFLQPSDGWQADTEFQNDCLAYALFHGQNRISVKEGENHWIPFTEREVEADEKFSSNFMTDFMTGKLNEGEPKEYQSELVKGKKEKRTTPLNFSEEAKSVFEAGKALWKYYHTKPNVNVNAAFYDIRAYFQGINAEGRMKNKSADSNYNELIADLRNKRQDLAKKIEPKVYEYAFLKSYE